MTEELHIPDECFRPKPDFKERPSSALVKHIRDFIKQTGKPHMWHGHTHTQPPEGARIVYLAEFDLPERLHKSPHLFAPCPCCSPTHPKYVRNGKVAWFPDEAIIRIIGPDCFAALDKEGHFRAIAQLRAEEQLAKDTMYLLAHLSKVPDAVRTLERALPTFETIDDVRDALRRGIPQAIKSDLWPHIKSGTLQVKHYTGEIATITQYAKIKGQRMLEPSDLDLAPTIRNALATLRNMDPGHDPKATIAAMSDEDRKKNARALVRNLNAAKITFRTAEEIRPFLSVQTIATLRNWGQHEGCPIHLHMMLDNNNLLVGRNEFEHRRFIIAPIFFAALGSLPVLAETDLAAE